MEGKLKKSAEEVPRRIQDSSKGSQDVGNSTRRHLCMHVCMRGLNYCSKSCSDIHFCISFLYGYWVKLSWYLSTKRHSEFKKVKSHNDRRTEFFTSLLYLPGYWKWYGKDYCVVRHHCHAMGTFSKRSTTIWCGRHCWWSYRWKWMTGWQICKRIDEMQRCSSQGSRRQRFWKTQFPIVVAFE